MEFRPLGLTTYTHVRPGSFPVWAPGIPNRNVGRLLGIAFGR
jgi:hypothetical protein